MSDLSELIERLEQAAGPDREIDRDLALAFGWSRELDHEIYAPHHPAPWYWTDPDGYSCGWRDGEIGPEDFTQSVDAALALIERVRPGWWWAVGHYGPNGSATANVSRDGKKHGPDVTAPTPALALCLALLRAMEKE